MNKTKIKRILSRFGIGDPLNALFYTSEETEEMRKKGIVIDMPIRKRRKQASISEKNVGKYGVMCGKFLTDVVFTTKEEAKSWAFMNYKGRTDAYSIIKFSNQLLKVD